MSKRTGTILIIVLAISVAINLFIAGSVSYYGMKLEKFEASPERFATRLMMRGEKRFLRGLEGEDRITAKDIFAQRRPLLSDSVREVHISRHEFMDALRENSNDTRALIAAIDRSERAARQANENFHGALRDLAMQLSPDALKKIGKRVGRGERGRRHHRDHQDDE